MTPVFWYQEVEGAPGMPGRRCSWRTALYVMKLPSAAALSRQPTAISVLPFLLLLSVHGLTTLTVAAATAQQRPPRILDRQSERASSVLPRGEPLVFEVREQISRAVQPPRPVWTVAGGALVFRPEERSRRDEFVIRRTPLDPVAARNSWYETDIEITEGDVAGIVLRASPTGAPCYGVLLGAESNTVRLVALPWPGRDLFLVARPIEHKRRYRLAVHCRPAPGGEHSATQITVFLDGEQVTAYTDNASRQVAATAGAAGTHTGLLVNNASARFFGLAAWQMTAAGEKGALLFRDDFRAPDRWPSIASTAPAPRTSCRRYPCRLRSRRRETLSPFRPDCPSGGGAWGRRPRCGTSSETRAMSGCRTWRPSRAL
jgi:hypothetical protein